MQLNVVAEIDLSLATLCALKYDVNLNYMIISKFCKVLTSNSTQEKVTYFNANTDARQEHKNLGFQVWQIRHLNSVSDCGCRIPDKASFELIHGLEQFQSNFMKLLQARVSRQ